MEIDRPVGDARVSTMSDEALQKYIDKARGVGAEGVWLDNAAIARIARSHQNVNAALARERALVAELIRDIEALRGRISAAQQALAGI